MYLKIINGLKFSYVPTAKMYKKNIYYIILYIFL